MTKLDEAWQWYSAAKTQLGLTRRMVERHWDALDTIVSFWQDERFKALKRDEVREQATRAAEPLEDLAVVVLFSTFEEIVRERVAQEVKEDSAKLTSTYLQSVAKDALQSVERGSFGRILGGLKQAQSSDLIEQVDQVRDYRNWVAHGRSEAKRDSLKARNITAAEAYRRLKALLDVLGVSAPTDGS